ncbi:hypothetical protein CHU92_05000 [Flavobacterium cyanobacteriorum]|uniref:Uncharacterized protein n=1 Tax=Flavobacterium cyanobacteriorum TaxID=2022802 RepID=A0A255ZA34_9FLAO|nr:hypothetical protein CHU92_05000 [Flavobacterium cyanobacteriorum]
MADFCGLTLLLQQFKPIKTGLQKGIIWMFYKFMEKLQPQLFLLFNLPEFYRLYFAGKLFFGIINAIENSIIYAVLANYS